MAFDSLTQNPKVDLNGHEDGAVSGVLTLHAGDTLHFNCHVEATAERASKLGVPMPSAPLNLGNKAFDAEMCILNTFVSGDPLEGGFSL